MTTLAGGRPRRRAGPPTSDRPPGDAPIEEPTPVVIRTRTLAVVFSVSLAAAACGGDDDAVADVAVPSTTAVTTTSQEVTTTTAATTTTEGAPEPTMPLTGLPASGNAGRPAVAVKIDNDRRARPQVGINDADLVFEEVVENGITRLVAVFHSDDADPVGPIRSARTTDVELLSVFPGIVFANSGSNAGTRARLQSAANLANVNHETAGALYFRQRDRPGPHNLFANTSELIGAGGDLVPPEPLFTFAEEAPGGRPVDGIDIGFADTQVSYAWDDELDGWARTQNGTPHVDAADVQVAPVNVVVMETVYGRSAADAGSPEAVVTGTGPAWVLSDGTLQEGTWSRDEADDPPTLTDADGDEMTLVPGSVWVELPRPGNVTVRE